MNHSKRFVHENKSTIILVVLTLFAGGLFTGGSAYYAYLRHTSEVKTIPSISTDIQRPLSSFAESPSAATSSASTTSLTQGSSSINSGASTHNLACSNAYSAMALGSNPYVDFKSRASVDAYNHANQSAYTTWLAAKAKLGCSQSLSPPIVIQFYETKSAPSGPATSAVTAAPPVAVCDEAAKGSLETAYQQALSQEDQRFSQQVNSYADGYGITGSALVQVSEMFMPQHQQNYTDLRTVYFTHLTSLHCTS